MTDPTPTVDTAALREIIYDGMDPRAPDEAYRALDKLVNALDAERARADRLAEELLHYHPIVGRLPAD